MEAELRIAADSPLCPHLSEPTKAAWDAALTNPDDAVISSTFGQWISAASVQSGSMIHAAAAASKLLITKNWKEEMGFRAIRLRIIAMEAKQKPVRTVRDNAVSISAGLLMLPAERRLVRFQ